MASHAKTYGYEFVPEESYDLQQVLVWGEPRNITVHMSYSRVHFTWGTSCYIQACLHEVFYGFIPFVYERVCAGLHGFRQVAWNMSVTELKVLEKI